VVGEMNWGRETGKPARYIWLIKTAKRAREMEMDVFIPF
jgi:hypothetical protein